MTNDEWEEQHLKELIIRALKMLWADSTLHVVLIDSDESVKPIDITEGGDRGFFPIPDVPKGRVDASSLMQVLVRWPPGMNHVLLYQKGRPS